MRIQVLVWSLARKAAYDFFRLVRNPDLPAIQNAAKKIRVLNGELKST
jgi:hypothetical protein